MWKLLLIITFFNQGGVVGGTSQTWTHTTEAKCMAALRHNIVTLSTGWEWQDADGKIVATQSNPNGSAGSQMVTGSCTSSNAV